MPAEDLDDWDRALSAALTAADTSQWDAARDQARCLAASLSGELADEWRLLLDDERVFRAAASALTAARLDAASALLRLSNRADLSRTVDALASGDLELVAAICSASSAIVDEGEKLLRRAICQHGATSLLGSALPDAQLLALHLKSCAEDEPSVRPDDADRIRRMLVALSSRRHDDEDGPWFEACAGALGTSVMDLPAAFAEATRAAHACIARGSRKGQHFQTVILFALLSRRDDEALAHKAAFEKIARSKEHPDAVWRRAKEAAADLHRRRGPAGMLTLADDWTKEHERLWSLLVPRTDEADAVQGELIRCTGKLADEAYRNGNVNFGPNHIAMIDYVERTLCEGGVFTAAEMEEIRRDTAAVRSNPEHLDLATHESCYYRLSACAVRWCRAHPKPIGREQGV